MKRFLLPAALVLLLASLVAPVSRAANAADPARAARVASGAEVKLAPSSRTAAQWTAERPKVRDLRPKVRGTFD